jgi:prefoldin subunit 5
LTNTTDFDQQDANGGSSPATPPPASGEQPIDWEARYKGMQRQFNNLQTQIGAKDTLIATLQTENNTLKSDKGSLSTQYEGQLAQLRSDVTARDTELSSLRETRTELEGKAQKLERGLKITTELSKPEYQGLAPYYAADYLKIPDDMEVGSEAFKTHLEGFKGLMNVNTQNNFQQVMGSVTPPQFGTATGSAKSGGMTQSELATWLENNPDHPDKAAFYDQYMTVVAQDMKS